MLELALLGHPEIRLDGESFSIPSKKSQALLYFLALSDRSHSRSTLAGLLWGGKPEADARRNLRVELNKLRRSLDQYLVISHSSIGFDHEQPCLLDAVTLREIATKPSADLAAAQRAVALVRGELLEDLQVQDAPEFEAWLVAEQEEYHRYHRTLLRQIVSKTQEANDLQEALIYAQGLLDAEPWREENHRLVIRLQAQMGHTSAAIAQYERCRMILAEDLGVEPSAETRALLDQIRNDRQTTTPVSRPIIYVHTPAHNLQAASTTFIGRDEEMDQVRELLTRSECRLLTLLGPGGIGKSRLALEIGRSWIINPDPIFSDGLFYVPLATATSEAAIISAIFKALEIGLSGSRSPKEQLLEAIRDRQLLLILDNFEQLIEQSGLLVEMLSAAQHLKCLVTSRQRLPLIESWNFDLTGLAVPESEVGENVTYYAAVQLFIERARRLDLGFDDETEKTGIVRICQLVEGLPLGIELAAAWVRGLTCSQIADHIATDLDSLSVTSPSLPGRQQSLKAVFTHSWDLLSKGERTLFANLSLFRGGFNFEAAELVARASKRHILNLVDKSLVRRSPTGRYEMHQVLVQLAQERLREPELAQLAERHARYFADFLFKRETKSGEVITPEIVEEISEELDNIESAWQWAVDKSDPEALNRAADTLARYYANRSEFIKGEAQFDRAAAAVSDRSHVWARLRQRQGQFLFRLGKNQETVALGEAVLPVLDAKGDHLEMARCLLYMGNAVRDMGEYDAASAYYQRSASLFVEVDDRLGLASVENNLGVVCFYQENLTDAIDHFEAAMKARQEAGVEDTTLELGNIGLCLGELGRFDEAAQYLEQSLALSIQLDARLTTGLSHHNLGNARRNLGQHQVSADHIEAATYIFRQLGSRDALAAALADLGSTYIELGRFDDAEAALLEGLELEQTLNRPRGIAYKHLGLGNLRLELGDMEQATCEFNQVIEIAGSEHGLSLIHGALVGLAIIKAQSGDPATAGVVLNTIHASSQSGPETRQQIETWSQRLDLPLDPASAAPSVSVEGLIQMLNS